MKLTRQNYFTSKNKYLSSSKLKEFYLDPYFFYKKHVLGEIDKHLTPSMMIGKACDAWLTRSKSAFYKEFTRGVLKKDNPDKFAKNKEEERNVLTPAIYDKVVDMCKTMEGISVYKDIVEQKFQSQVILKIDKPTGLFEGLAGIPDWFKIDGKKCILVDLKTVADSTPNKFYNQCRSYMYFFQIAVYQELIKANYPEVEEFESYFLVIENGDEPHRVGLFKCNQDIIKLEANLLESLLAVISEMKAEDYKPRDVSWDDAFKFESF